MYGYLQSFLLALTVMFIVFFGALTKKSLSTIKYLNPTYRFAIAVTICVMGIVAAILINNGQASQRFDTLLFMSLYSIVNLYLFFMAYLYQPATYTANRS